MARSLPLTLVAVLFTAGCQSDAPELQGDGQALGEMHQEDKEERQDGDQIFFFLFKNKKRGKATGCSLENSSGRGESTENSSGRGGRGE